MSSYAALSAGYIGNQAHYANGLTAMYLACGQDAACTAESAIGITRFEKQSKNGAENLYVSVTMPNIVVGTVGGGAKLPSSKACLDLLGLEAGNPNSSKEFAEIIAAACLGGEISIVAAMTANQFTQAHINHARR
jgi:hydroxymethylglutaryl-CoA reductase (NADPH)